ncbi:DUF72 domain-containing protein [Marinomonas piezotolerans]|nr:DUF72 domain-containing protein [Marinomonas piezotolerans]
MDMIRFGMAQWQHPAWVDWIYPRSEAPSSRLGYYARFFNSVEVGSTFYTEVAADQIIKWAALVSSDFRFSFKVPRGISHQLNEIPFPQVLQHWQRFQDLLLPIQDQLGPTMLQFPASVDVSYLDKISQLCNEWRLPSSLSVEVRSLSYFDKFEGEASLLRVLANGQYDKVVMDSRPVFSTDAYCESLVEAQRKKPRVPCHAVATGFSPVVRFVGHPDLERNHFWLDQWADKLLMWLEEGRSPTVFVHSSDNIAAPTLAAWLDDKLDAKSDRYAKRLLLPSQHDQIGLF